MNHKQIMLQIVWFPWALWCVFVFIAALIIGFPLLFIAVVSGNEKWIRKAHFVPAVIARVVLKLWGIRIEIKGKEFIQPNRQLVYISNHTSYLDALVAGAVIPNFLKYLGKAEILYWPVLGYLLKKLYVPVWRDDQGHRRWSMEQMNEKLKTGASFFICPEGTCNITNQPLLPFHNGAFRLAIENQLPLVPLTFIGAACLFPRKGIMIRSGKVIVCWHPPIDTTGMNEGDAQRLKRQAIEIITANLLNQK